MPRREAPPPAAATALLSLLCACLPVSCRIMVCYSSLPAWLTSGAAVGAVDALAKELLQYPSETQWLLDSEQESLPKVSYMQSLSAIVKIVGGDSMMGKASIVSPANARPFIIDGCNTTKE